MNVRAAYTAAVAVAAGLCVLQVFLPWMSLDLRVPILGSIAEVTRYGYQGDGLITLLVGAIALGFVAYLWSDRSGKAFRLVAIFNVCLGALIVATALVNLVDSERGLGGAQQNIGIDLEELIGLDLSEVTKTEAGVYVAIAAGVVLAVASLAAGFVHQSAAADGDSGR